MVIDSVRFGSVTISGKRYRQVLIVEDKVFERDFEKLQQTFGTTHKIGGWEIKKLFETNPEIIVVGTGWQGELDPGQDLENQAKEKGIEFAVLPTPKAVELFNEKIEQGKKVNALIHTTC